MNFLKNIFTAADQPIKSNEDFWNWFMKNEKAFFKAVKERTNVEKDFFDKLSPKLNELKHGIFYLTGMLDENTADLILTPDGLIANIVFVEELINAAPQIPGWSFQALKPASDITNTTIEMAGYKFSSENLSFYFYEEEDFPDEIDIKIVHKDFTESNKSQITNGTYIFLDNYLGELNFITSIDSITVIGPDTAEKELIPIEKLRDYLIWRQKEFIEKYEGLRIDTENDEFDMLEAELSNGNVLLAVINTTLLQWDGKASHPWILTVEIKYKGENSSGMPDDKTFKLLDEMQDEILKELKDYDGYLNIGRQTSENVREIYFACNDFRKPAKVMYFIQQKYSKKLNLTYDFYKDKYWKTFNRFIN